MIYISSFQNGLNHSCGSTSFYFQKKIVEGSREMWSGYVFLTFGFFSKCTSLRLRHFIPPSTDLLYSICSVVACIYKIYVFDEAFFLLAIVAVITERCIFSISMATFVRENLFIKSCNLLIQIILEKNGIR